MKRNEQDELLNDLLSGEEVSEFRKASLASGLADISRRRRQRQAMRMVVMVLLPVLVVAAVMLHQHKSQPVRQVVSVKATAPVLHEEKSDVKIISDEELFALFPGRSMALVGKPGEQRLVFLDGGGAQAKAQ